VWARSPRYSACYGALLLQNITFVFRAERASIKKFLASRVCGCGARVYMAMAPVPAHAEGIVVEYRSEEGAARRGKARVPTSR
jgi:hypothetical protein